MCSLHDVFWLASSSDEFVDLLVQKKQKKRKQAHKDEDIELDYGSPMAVESREHGVLQYTTEGLNAPVSLDIQSRDLQQSTDGLIAPVSVDVQSLESSNGLVSCPRSDIKIRYRNPRGREKSISIPD